MQYFIILSTKFYFLMFIILLMKRRWKLFFSLFLKFCTRLLIRRPLVRFHNRAVFFFSNRPTPQPNQLQNSTWELPQQHRQVLAFLPQMLQWPRNAQSLTLHGMEGHGVQVFILDHIFHISKTSERVHAASMTNHNIRFQC